MLDPVGHDDGMHSEPSLSTYDLVCASGPLSVTCSQLTCSALPTDLAMSGMAAPEPRPPVCIANKLSVMFADV